MIERFVDPNAAAGGNGTTDALSGANCAYASLSIWEAARQGTLGDIERATCKTNGGAADTTPLVMNGSTTTSAFYFDIVVDPAHRHDGKWNTAKYRLVGAAAFVFMFDGLEPYTRVTGLQIENTDATGVGGFIHDPGVVTANDDARFDALLVRETQNGDGIVSADGRARFTNCASYGHSGDGFRVNFGPNGPGTVEWLNCVAVGNGLDGFVSSSGSNSHVAKNCYSGGNTGDDYDSSIPLTLTTCASEDATGTSGLTGIAPSTSSGAFFTNVTAGSEDFHIGASSALKDAGTDLSGTFTLDIDGQTRAAPWDIGIDEIVAGAPPDLSIVFNLQIG